MLPGATLAASVLLRATPDQAVLLACLGMALIFVELNRPGLILAGSLGRLLVLLGAASLAHQPLRSSALLLLLLATATLTLNLWKPVPASVNAVASVALALSFRFLVVPHVSAPVHSVVAIPCGLILGTLAAALSGVARRARRLKQVN